MKKILLAVILLASFSASLPAAQQTAHLFLKLPAFAVTPDGMAVAPDGALIVSCPNFASSTLDSNAPSVPACLIRIDLNGVARKWVELPPMPETGRICPMGIEFGPDGALYMVDNQNWAGGNGADGTINQGRILRLVIHHNKIEELTVVAKGISHPNGIRYRDGNLFVTVSALPKVKRPDGLLVSGVYRFPASGKEIAVNNTLDDKNLIASFVTHNRFTQYGLDGIVFDSKGNLYVGNFGDGTIHKLVLDAAGNVVANTLFAHTNFDTTRDPAQPGFLEYAAKTKLRTTDGICVDADNNLYVADFSNNSIDKVTPSGQITVLAQNGDNDGQTGELNEPGEPIVWGGRLVVSNFDAVSGPDKVHTAHHGPATLSVIELSR
ncbi:MAG: hypothetical protein P4K83_10485 [Terracidiphilus sp.]|nr:hypothetical protein [Terracidiphilus sp.]